MNWESVFFDFVWVFMSFWYFKDFKLRVYRGSIFGIYIYFFKLGSSKFGFFEGVFELEFGSE